MSYRTIEVRKLTPTIGGEVSGVDLAEPFDDEVLADLHDALADHLVLFFRDQHLTVDQHKAFGRHFGELHVHPNAPKPLADHPEILVVAADERSKHVAGEDWHSDVSCEPEPPMGSMLYLTEVPPDGGGDTMFANMYAAYEALSPLLQELLEQCTAIHDSAKAHAYRRRSGEEGLEYPHAEHPVVRTHPVTGRKLLFVNRGFTTRIAQLSRPESDALLEMLYRHIETPEFCCRFGWQPNSLAFWDNRCVQHHALFDYFPNRRYGHRVTICGDKPY